MTYDYHFIGIGGVGMSFLAQVLLEGGASVSGSDAKSSETTRRLASLGARVAIGHDPDLVDDVRKVVRSSAIPEQNAELQRARELGLPIMHRGELLAEFVNGARGVVVAGSHGKTTTTAMLATVFLHADTDPTIFVGGKVKALGSNARSGRGPHVIAEADESDKSFLNLYPACAVVTNIDDDHLVNYGGSRENLVLAFEQFMTQIRDCAVLCADDPTTASLATPSSLRIVSYGLEQRPVAGAGRHYYADNIMQQKGSIGSSFTVRVLEKEGRMSETRNEYDGYRMQLGVPGRHNVQNALAVIAIASAESLPVGAVAEALKAFPGAGRRFQVAGTNSGVTMVDDYAHHPTEVRVTLEAARLVSNGRVVVVFQPHLYSRTRQLADNFARSLSVADVCVLLPVFGAREDPVEGVTSKLIEEPLRATNNTEVYVASGHDDAVGLVKEHARPGDIVILMGAGDVNTLAPRLLS